MTWSGFSVAFDGSLHSCGKSITAFCLRKNKSGARQRRMWQSYFAAFHKHLLSFNLVCIFENRFRINDGQKQNVISSLALGNGALLPSAGVARCSTKGVHARNKLRWPSAVIICNVHRLTSVVRQNEAQRAAQFCRCIDFAVLRTRCTRAIVGLVLSNHHR